jgi:ABC-type dipeptide/oligopeptide/nickel transport system permease component
VVAFLVRRVAHGVGALVAVAFLAYGLERALRPENHPGQPYFSSLWHDVTRALLHLDFGRSCGRPGCPDIHALWVGGLAGDITMVVGGMAIAILGGVRLGVWCARRPRSFVSRAAEGAGMVAFCAPVYVVGMGLLLLFNHDFGIVRVPLLFDALPGNYAKPWSDPWDWLRAYLVPCVVVAAPLAGACVRVTAAMTREELGADHVLTNHHCLGVEQDEAGVTVRFKETSSGRELAPVKGSIE